MARTLNLLFLLILAASGAALIWLGARLALLGGSPWYLLTGLVMMATAALGARRRLLSVSLFWAFLATNLAWALWEVGLDGWALAPRLAMPLCLGLWMLTPWYRRWLRIDRQLSAGRLLWRGLALLLAGGVGLSFWSARLPAPTDSRPGPGPSRAADGDWIAYGNDRGGSRFSPLAQITPGNVGALVPAWTYHTGPLPAGARAAFQANPLKVGDRLFVCTGYNDVIALDPETGRELWRYRPHTDNRGIYGLVCRGVAYYRVPGAAGACAERIYTATVDARLIALDAASGRPCRNFGRDGTVDLLTGMGPVEKSYYLVTSPPAIVRGRLVLGGWVTDGQRTGEPSGVIRAFNAVTGAFSWAFDIGRPTDHALPPPGAGFTRGTPNSWAPMSSDEALGLVYVPTGNATPDYFGAHRTANDERFASSVVALDAGTGAVRWTFQTTHHDLWDYDVASQPSLVDLPNSDRALIQPTKRGEIFVLDRVTGRPLFPVVERPVPQGGVPEERLSPTQPYSTALPAFAGPRPSERGMWGLTPIDQAFCRIRFREARFDGDMTPLGVDRPTLTWPGYLGGIDWGGIAIDKKRGLMIVNNNQVANYNRLIPRAEAERMGVRPSTLSHMSDVGGPAAQIGVPYAARIAPFLSPLAIPCQQPPYGRINAVDLRTGKLVWSRRLGTSRDSGPLTLPTFLPIPMGVPNIGGAVSTAGGVTFIGATQEHAFRAYDTASGRALWRARLPAGGNASPSSYWSAASGRQFVVIAAGGHGAMLSGSSDALIAYALPKR
ncbi:membrane-bound PQQ-dependent dehydrogenase, glucose/quinate/shikimate family [Sphingomonas solaris]|uniref:Membrane-bound PQQ-dependent dehydrogenase, glucose/quinate/shikimate family n=1 Tax=Alterirhizorhabdus solaris TaxID=2529389 RepID=A0A558RCP2_9SPHN|nr:membrane-bound PQQ-dependent dehydrogenase, glucose/quinate/shikimate family [Sphingomonas solaris]TVV77118.1 membrane-bound PQQ-dependent dehydrogenase, glucose/quinate/shikimate family [Sphingomonas solaris]